MKFTNLPRPIPVPLYDEAVRDYARRVAPRARAVYRVGELRHPGISDVDLLVVPRRARFDNGAWFAVRSQLPPALRAPFRSNPCVVPADGVDLLRFTTHRRRRLVCGEDLAAGVTCLDTPEQRWSMLFERLSQFDRVRRRVLERNGADLWNLVSKTKSVAYSLSEADSLLGSRRAPGFADEVEALRAGFFERAPDEAGVRTWRLFREGLEAIETVLREHLDLQGAPAPAAFGQAFLHGRASIPGLSEARLAERRRAVEWSQRAVRVLGWRKGDLFVRTPYADRIAALNAELHPSTLGRALVDGAYWLRGAAIACSVPRRRSPARRPARTPGHR